MRFSTATLLYVAATTAPTQVRGLSSQIANTVASKVAGARCLGGSDLVVSEACLGTMTWGLQNTQDEAFAQLDYAINDCGVNFVDTAELYPVPTTASEWEPGTTETIIGNYLSKVGSVKRDDLVIASKVVGYIPESPIATARYEEPTATNEDCRLDAASVRRACDASLRRLQTDRIDLYQVHWPDRYIPLFGQTLYNHESKREDSVPIEETAAALRDLIEEGKIRYIGVSNETPFGLVQRVNACEKLRIRDKLATIQNSYSLVDRRFDGDLAEVCDAYNIGLLPWSVLAGGLLSGKYLSNTQSSSSRYELYPEFMSRWSPTTASEQTLQAVGEYATIAQQAGISLSELAIRFAASRRFVADNGSTILGATTMEQLKQNLAPFSGGGSSSSSSSNTSVQPLDDDVLAAINEVHAKCPDPSCSL